MCDFRAGTYNPVAGTSDCLECSVGHYCPKVRLLIMFARLTLTLASLQGSATPLPCDAGRFANVGGQTDANCLAPCPRGFWWALIPSNGPCLRACSPTVVFGIEGAPPELGRSWKLRALKADSVSKSARATSLLDLIPCLSRRPNRAGRFELRGPLRCRCVC